MENLPQLWKEIIMAMAAISFAAVTLLAVRRFLRSLRIRMRAYAKTNLLEQRKQEETKDKKEKGKNTGKEFQNPEINKLIGFDFVKPVTIDREIMDTMMTGEKASSKTKAWADQESKGFTTTELRVESAYDEKERNAMEGMPEVPGYQTGHKEKQADTEDEEIDNGNGQQDDERMTEDDNQAWEQFMEETNKLNWTSDQELTRFRDEYYGDVPTPEETGELPEIPDEEERKPGDDKMTVNDMMRLWVTDEETEAQIENSLNELKDINN